MLWCSLLMLTCWFLSRTGHGNLTCFRCAKCPASKVSSALHSCYACMTKMIPIRKRDGISFRVDRDCVRDENFNLGCAVTKESVTCYCDQNECNAMLATEAVGSRKGEQSCPQENNGAAAIVVPSLSFLVLQHFLRHIAISL